MSSDKPRSRSLQHQARTLAQRHGISYHQALNQLREVPLSDKPLGAAEWFEPVYPGEPLVLPLTDSLEQEITEALADVEDETIFFITPLHKPVEWREPRAEYDARLETILERIRLLRSRGISKVRGTCIESSLYFIPVGNDERVLAGSSDRVHDWVTATLPELHPETVCVPPRILGLQPLDLPRLEWILMDSCDLDDLLGRCRFNGQPLPGRSAPLKLELLPPIPELVEALEKTQALTPEMVELALASGVELTVRTCSGYPAPEWAVEMINDASDTGWSWSEWPASTIHAADQGAKVEINCRRGDWETGSSTPLVSAPAFEQAAREVLRLAAAGYCSRDSQDPVFVGKPKPTTVPVTPRVLLGEMDTFLTNRAEAPFQIGMEIHRLLGKALSAGRSPWARTELTHAAEKRLAARLGLEAASAVEAAGESGYARYLERAVPLLTIVADGGLWSRSEREKAWRVVDATYPSSRRNEADDEALSAVRHALGICAESGRERRRERHPQRAFGYLSVPIMVAAYLRGGKTELRRTAVRTRELVLDAATESAGPGVEPMAVSSGGRSGRASRPSASG